MEFRSAPSRTRTGSRSATRSCGQAAFPNPRACSFERGFQSLSNRERQVTIQNLSALPKKVKPSALLLCLCLAENPPAPRPGQSRPPSHPDPKRGIMNSCLGLSRGLRAAKPERELLDRRSGRPRPTASGSVMSVWTIRMLKRKSALEMNCLVGIDSIQRCMGFRFRGASYRGRGETENAARTDSRRDRIWKTSESSTRLRARKGNMAPNRASPRRPAAILNAPHQTGRTRRAFAFKISDFPFRRLMAHSRQNNNEEQCLEAEDGRIPRYFSRG